ncbi:hypothetical protein [Nocardioides sp. GY 10127]|uniref:hypothetical protein n=1 Tax=Nocardioides sp. GY 10127 TaxID=2569762 RepID=UPI0010A7FC5F|nr:hypothetical protein [Nocardioides sp. GY 10127]TIC81627.1 hypothetical protein E8D37_10475 [Nocardioides sp. GY 10127]
MTGRGDPRDRDDRGSALVELSWLVILLLVPLLWALLGVFEVQRGAFATESAARAAARAYVLAPDDASGATAARAAAVSALADQGVESAADVSVSCGSFTDCHSGTAVVTVEVSTSVDLPFPDVLGAISPTFALHASHAVPVGRYQEVSG